MPNTMVFSKNVSTGREAFLKEVSTLPLSFKKSVLQNYKSRLARGHGKPLLGEYAPWFLADILPLNNRSDVAKMMPAWLSLYAYTLFIDDVMDAPDTVDISETLLASSLLLQRGLTSMVDQLPQNGMVRVKMDQYFIEAAEAALKEIKKHRESHSNYKQKDIVELGKKVALLKLCASYLLLADGHINIQEEVLVPVEYIATGAQLLDDAADWEEDWKKGTYTYLLQQTSVLLKEKGLKVEFADLTRDEVLVGMILTGSLENCIEKGRGYLAKVLTSSQLDSSKPTFALLQGVIREQGLFNDEVADARKMFEGMRVNNFGKYQNWLKKLTQQPEVKRELKKIERRLTIVAQST